MGESDPVVIPVEANTAYEITAEIQYPVVPPDLERLSQALAGFRRFMQVYAEGMAANFRHVADAFARLNGSLDRSERLRRMHEAYRRRQ